MTNESNEVASLAEEIRGRGITRLVHFTPVLNLVSIIEHGALLSRTRLAALNIELPELHIMDYLEINDPKRLDDLRNYINLSVQHPNHFLLKRFLEASLSIQEDWCVIELDPALITTPETRFSVTNAASSHAKRMGVGTGLERFRAMFAESVEYTSATGHRRFDRTNLPDHYTTDNQAEVLVKDAVPVAFITSVHLASDSALRKARAALTLTAPHCVATLPPMLVDPSIFLPRS